MITMAPITMAPITTTMTMDESAREAGAADGAIADWLGPLLAWLSPSYPTGGFSYSHGLEWAVEAGWVHDVASVVDFVAAVVEAGGGWVDLVLFVAAWRAVLADDAAALDDIADRAAAFRGSAETAAESNHQGAAFATVTMAAWPRPALTALWRRRQDAPLAHPVAVAVACAGLVPLSVALPGFCHALAANLVSAGVRLVPLGQTDGQRALAALVPVIRRATAAALVTDLDDLGTSVPLVERASMRHETQYTRLFRS